MKERFKVGIGKNLLRIVWTAIATSTSIRLFSQKDKLTVHVLKLGGAVDVPRFEASSSEICPREVGTDGKSFGEVSVLQVCALEGCAAEVYPFEFGSVELYSVEVSVAEVDAEVGLVDAIAGREELMDGAMP